MTKRKGYWDVPLTEEEERQLEPELFSELNEMFQEEDEEDLHQDESEDRSGVKLVGLVTVTLFTLFVLGNMLQVFALPSLDFLQDSRKLSNDPRIKELREAVVIVHGLGSRGTGFNIEAEGLIITNHHVIEGANAVNVSFSKGDAYSGINWVEFPEIDLAIIKLEEQKLPKVELEQNSYLRSGEEVTIIGNPLGFPQVVKKGEVIGYHQLNNWKDSIVMIRAPIHQGSSGSPVFNQEGRVVGVIFATLKNSLSSNDGEEIIGLAVPINLLLERLE